MEFGPKQPMPEVIYEPHIFILLLQLCLKLHPLGSIRTAIATGIPLEQTCNLCVPSEFLEDEAHVVA